MEAFLSLPHSERRRLCDEGEDRLGLPAASLEKDLWVCWTLRELFALPLCRERLTFKGGTSLSKGWQLIDRFSEDVDVVIDRDLLGYGGERLSGGQIKKLRRACQKWIREELWPALDRRFAALLGAAGAWSLAPASLEEDRDQGTLLFAYPSAYSGPAGYVRPVVRIELGARSDTEPSETAGIAPYLEPLLSGRSAGVAIRTVAPRRTFWEKAMLLHEESFRPEYRPRPARLARHYYDLWCLVRKSVAEQALADIGLFERVAAHRQLFREQSWVDYATLRLGSLRLVPAADRLGEWRRDYAAMREMFFSDPPDFDQVLAVVGAFESRCHELGNSQ